MNVAFRTRVSRCIFVFIALESFARTIIVDVVMMMHDQHFQLALRFHVPQFYDQAIGRVGLVLQLRVSNQI